MNWDDLRIFLTVVDSGGIGRAAPRLRLSHATVWRRVRALEESLEVELFDRSAQGFVPSEAGSVLFQRLRGLDRVIDGGVQAVWDDGGTPRGEVKVGVPFDRLGRLFAERAPEMSRRHPRLIVELTVERPSPQIVHGYDIVVANDAVDLDGFDRVADFALRFGLYASPGYMARRPSGPGASGTRLDFISCDHNTRAAMQVSAKPLSDLLSAFDDHPVSFRCSHPNPRNLAARTGMGVILSAELAVDADSGLVQLADWTVAGATPISLHVKSACRREMRVSVVLEVMRKALSVLPEWREHLAEAASKSHGRMRKAG